MRNLVKQKERAQHRMTGPAECPTQEARQPRPLRQATQHAHEGTLLFAVVVERLGKRDLQDRGAILCGKAIAEDHKVLDGKKRRLPLVDDDETGVAVHPLLAAAPPAVQEYELQRRRELGKRPRLHLAGIPSQRRLIRLPTMSRISRATRRSSAHVRASWAFP